MDVERSPAPADKKSLRSGYTTGACAAAATKAAATALLTGSPVKEIEITLPIGKKVTFAVVRCELSGDTAEAEVVKDAGDDPDCTHLAHIISTVRRNGPGISIEGGAGVGRITKPGLGLEVGGPAINPVPRQMIAQAVLEATGASDGFAAVISVPGGEEMAKKTLNARLGIVGGISILGTTGIVKPFSTAAYKASIEQAIDVAVTGGSKTVALTTGGKSERFAQAAFPDMPEDAFIQMGDFVGFSLKAALQRGVTEIRICGMPGKISKVAQGRMMTHAAGSEVDLGLLSKIAAACGAPQGVVGEIAAANTARHVYEIVEKHGVPGFFDKICERVVQNCEKHIARKAKVACLLTDFEGKRLGSHGIAKN
ncbi:cobalt-precorrin-5B (C(1))-methyltransferase [bacterium]|nr:cobalt-precorrin-5B (C(1))-methyltransferase [bacterium]